MFLNGRPEGDDFIPTDQSRQHEERQGRDEHNLDPGFHARHGHRKDHFGQRLPVCGAQVMTGLNVGVTDICQWVVDGQDHERNLDVGRYQNKAGIGEQHVLGGNADQSK